MLFESLKESCRDDWKAYVEHEFVLGLGTGELPEEAFRHYLIQDYHFLIHFARAFALAGYKARTVDDLKRAKEGMGGILDVELDLHLDYCRKWGMSEDEVRAVPEASACLAYTRYVLERGMAGGLLDLHVALAPCMLGYAEIAEWLSDQPWLKREGNPYSDWIAMYSGDEYREVAADERAYIESLAGREGVTAARRAELERTFREATRLEAAFWQMGLDRSF